MQAPPAIRGERVSLRHVEPSDRTAVLDLRRASREHLEPWEPASPPHFDNFGDAYFDRELQHTRTPSEERLLIITNDADRIVGRLSIGAIERGVLQSARFGYWLGAPFTGRGLMTDALGLGLEYAFNSLSLHRVSCNIIPRNEPSKRAALNAGFKLEGFSPRYLRVAGVWEDHERYALTVEDWRERRNNASGLTRTTARSPAST